MKDLGVNEALECTSVSFVENCVFMFYDCDGRALLFVFRSY